MAQNMPWAFGGLKYSKKIAKFTNRKTKSFHVLFEFMKIYFRISYCWLIFFKGKFY